MEHIVEKLNSQVAGVTWPRFLPPAGAQLLSLIYQMEKSQYAPPEWHQQQQLHQASLLLHHARRYVPYYNHKFPDLPERLLTFKEWRQLPVITRKEVQSAGQGLFSHALPEGHGQTGTVSTSGSTGMPVTCLTTDVTRTFWMASSLFEHLLHTRDVNTKHLSIRPSADVPPGQLKKSKSWAPPIQTGDSLVYNVRTDVERQLQIIQAEEPAYILSLPSNLMTLAEICRKKAISLPYLKGVRSYGEALSLEVKQYCEEAWNVPLTDVYSSQELGNLAFQCPEHRAFHALTDGVMIEVLNEEGKPCQTGEVGQVVVTTLLNYASPLIRYALGDYARVGEACPCGRTYPVLDQIMGRERNMLLLADGRKIWPSFAVRDWADKLPLLQFQFVQKSTEMIEARIVSDRHLTEDETARLKNALHERLQHPFELVISYLDEIPRSKSGKYEDFVSEIRTDYNT